MKKTISRRILSLALALCLLLSLAPAMKLVSEVDALTSQWRGIATADTYIVADANNPFNVTLSGTAKAYYTKKINVQTGTKISFNVNFSAYQSDAGMQYTFSLVDREGVVYQNGVGNALSAELISAAGGNVRAVTSRKIAGGSNRDWMTNITNPLSAARDTAAVYTFTFEKLPASEENSWKVSIDNGTTTQESLIPAAKVAHDLFQNGVYLAVGNMTTATGHVVNVSDLVVTQPNTASNWKVVRNAGLNGIVGELTPEGTNAFDATFNEFVTGYYDQKIKVQEGTTVSFRVQFPKMTDGINVQYAFSLVDRAGSFYTSDKNANSMSLEVASIMNNGTAGALNAVASKKLSGAASRTFLANAFSLAAARSTTDVYDVTFKKINEDYQGENCSWLVTVMKNGTTPYAYRFKAADIPHDFFADGAYLAVGSMDGGATHTLKVSNLVINNSWSSVAPAGTVIPGCDLVPEGVNAFDVSFRNKAAGTYDRAIQVQEGTKISMKAKMVATTANQAMWFSVSLADQANAFYNAGTGNALMVELGSSNSAITNMPSVVSKKIPGGGNNNRLWLLNVGTLAGSRATNMIYTITYEKLAATEANSWKITVNNGTTDFTVLVPIEKFAHDMLGDEVYIAAGFMSAVNGHNVDLFDLSVTQPDAGATVGGVEYDSLQDALDNTFAGETVELKEDLELTEALDLANTDVTLDIGSNTVSGETIATLSAGSNLTIVADGGELEGKLELAESGAKITSDCPITLEMNGKDATVNAENVTLIDSATNEGAEGGKIYGDCDVTDTVITKDDVSYVVLDHGNYLTSNAVRVNVKKISVRPSAAGIYYTTELKFNKNIVGAGATYGVVLSTTDKPGADFMTEKNGENFANLWTVGTPTEGEDFISTGNSCLVKNIFTEDAGDANVTRGETEIYANGYVKLTVDGEEIVIMAENNGQIKYSLKSVMKAMDTKLQNELAAYDGVTELTGDAKKVFDFFGTWMDAMAGWDLTNLVAAFAKKAG